MGNPGEAGAKRWVGAAALRLPEGTPLGGVGPPGLGGPGQSIPADWRLGGVGALWRGGGVRTGRGLRDTGEVDEWAEWFWLVLLRPTATHCPWQEAPLGQTWEIKGGGGRFVVPLDVNPNAPTHTDGWRPAYG